MSLHTISTDMQKQHKNGISWVSIGKQYNIFPSMARMIAMGYNPGKKIRCRLGLPPMSTVIIVTGTIPDGTQSLGALLCPCGRWFIPNTGKRKRCFVCTPFRRRK